MQPIIFCTSFIKNEEAWGERYSRWLNYYNQSPIADAMKFMIDDGSPFTPPGAMIDTVSHKDSIQYSAGRNVLVRFPNNLGRQSGAEYPGWWRSFFHSINIARAVGAQKIIHIESDAYILSESLFDFVNEVESGWHVLWARRYGMPETAIQVICRDQFDSFARFKAQAEETPVSDIAERVLPFTSVDKRFKGDRYSEFKRNRGMFFKSRKFNAIPLFQCQFFWEPIPEDADFATQVVKRQKIAPFQARNRQSGIAA
ncbi:hypothetical protein [Burkholderia ubonensis]|uniref:hypothetical protein n=1 Tax=Burkholderia ubonensis TaxID=101571 RepID=UPI0012FA0903|nr:hypothetical protein [Burkholderia ubonensis]